MAGGFEFAEERLGLRNARTLIVESPFDYQHQALLYVPQHLPDPRNPAFTSAASEEIVRLLELSRGRAFVLFTSYQQMRLVYDRVSFEIEYPTLLQGTAPRSALLEEFRSTPNAVLFATSSFWQGVDVQGEQLSCVIIDKLPFAVPSDPDGRSPDQGGTRRGRRTLLLLSDSASGDRAEAGIWPVDPKQGGSRRRIDPGQPHHQAAVRAGFLR